MRAQLFVFALLLTGPAAAAQCQLVRVAEWPLRLERDQPVVEGVVNGRKVEVLLDTGANTTVMARSAAMRLGLERQHVGGVEVYGIGGATRTEMTEIDEFRLGQAVRRNWRILVVGEHEFGGNIAIILGEDFFENVDLELDFANKVVRLFQPRDCARSPLAYWDSRAPRVDLEPGGRLVVPVNIDGTHVLAELDTGATRSVLDLRVAAQAGVTPSSPGVTAGGCSIGIGKKLVEGWIAPMNRFSIGDEIIHNPRLAIADMASGVTRQETGSRIAKAVSPPDMLLGADFLFAHRVLVSHSQRALYFTHNGRSPVFSTARSAGCGELSGARADDRIAAYDAELRQNPDDAEALYRRAVAYATKGDDDHALADFDAAFRAGRDSAALHHGRGNVLFRKRDFDRALADYERVLELEPGNLDALFNRSLTLQRKKQYDRALAGLDAYLDKRPGDVKALSARARTKLLKGRSQEAYADYDAILKADATNRRARRERGLALFYDSRYVEAQGDFAAWLRAENSPYAALWLYLARLRAGEDGSPDLANFARDAPTPQWPAAIVRYHLGQISGEELLANAARDATSRRAQECEARFHIAERRLAARDAKGAAPLLRQAVAECPDSFDEYLGSVAELTRLEGKALD